jgi:3-hydroxyisobutyrate dehydrogenase
VTLKLVNNYLLGVNQVALAEALMMARSAGLDDQTFAETIGDASGASYALDRNMSRFVIPDEYSSEFTLDLMEKDLGLAERFAEQSDVPLLLGEVSGLYRVAAAMGYGDLDCSAILKLYEELRR